MSHGARERLREHWDARYATFSLDESGCLGAGAGLSRMIYRAKEAALGSALDAAGFSRAATFRVLDMACGFGYFAGYYRAAFPHASYTGVDISARAIVHARDTMPFAEFFADDAVTWRHPRHARFDVIQAIDVLQLLIDDGAFDGAVRTLAAHLTNDGVLLVPLVFSDAPPSATHHRVRSRAYFDRLIATLGLQVIHEGPMYYWLVDGGPTSRLARAVFARTGAHTLYLVDRLALALGLENRRPEHVLSRARMLTIRRVQVQDASGPRNTASAG
ncbi:MAG: class I SAM-dependent DNA methyltransferase [Vicinamibacterales bacterium]